jgi:hypothetical protein
VNGTAIFFWLGMAGLLLVSLVLGRWHAEDMARRVADTYGHRSVRTPGHDPVRGHVGWQDVESPDAEFPDDIERASA